MNHSELVQNLVKPGQDIIDTLTPSTINLLHMAVGISGEAAEMMYGLLKHDLENVQEEMGDIEFYYEGLCQELDYWPAQKEITMDVDDTVVPSLIVTTGDVLDAVKKVVIYNTGDIDPVQQKLTAFRMTLDCCYDYLGIDRDEVIQLNIAKLTIRYGETYSDEAAQQRVDKEGAE